MSSTGSGTGGIDDLNNRKHNRMANWRVLYYLYVEDNELMDEHSWEGTKWLDLITEEVAGDYYVRTKKRLSGFYPPTWNFCSTISMSTTW